MPILLAFLSQTLATSRGGDPGAGTCVHLLLGFHVSRVIAVRIWLGLNVKRLRPVWYLPRFPLSI